MRADATLMAKTHHRRNIALTVNHDKATKPGGRQHVHKHADCHAAGGGHT